MAHKHFGQWKFENIKRGDKNTTCLVRLEIDLDRIMDKIGYRASRNSSGMSKYLDGAIIARLINVEVNQEVK